MELSCPRYPFCSYLVGSYEADQSIEFCSHFCTWFLTPSFSSFGETLIYLNKNTFYSNARTAITRRLSVIHKLFRSCLLLSCIAVLDRISNVWFVYAVRESVFMLKHQSVVQSKILASIFYDVSLVTAVANFSMNSYAIRVCIK